MKKAFYLLLFIIVSPLVMVGVSLIVLILGAAFILDQATLNDFNEWLTK